MQTLMRPLGMSQKETMPRIKENTTPALCTFMRIRIAGTQRKRFDLERTYRALHQPDFSRENKTRQEVPRRQRRPVEEQQQQAGAGSGAAWFCAKLGWQMDGMDT